MMEEIGFTDVVIGDPVDTFGGASGEANARTFAVFGYAFCARSRSGPDADPTQNTR